MYLALRALFHRASSGLVKEKDFWHRAHGCHNSEFLHCFSCWKVTPGTWEVKISGFTNNPRRVGHWMCYLCGNEGEQVPTQPSLRHGALWWYSGNKNGWKTSFWGTVCLLLCIALDRSKIIQAPNESAELEEESETWVSWGWGDWGQSRVGSRQSKCWCLPCNTLGSNSAGQLGWLCPLAMI